MSTRLGHGQRSAEGGRSEQRDGEMCARGIQEGGMERKGMRAGRICAICLVAIACVVYLCWPAFAFRLELSYSQVPSLSSGGIAAPSLRKMATSVSRVQSHEGSTFPRVATGPEVNEDEMAGDNKEAVEVASNETKVIEADRDEVARDGTKAVAVEEVGLRGAEAKADEVAGDGDMEDGVARDETVAVEVAGGKVGGETKPDDVAGDETEVGEVARDKAKGVDLGGDEVAGEKAKAVEVAEDGNSGGEVVRDDSKGVAEVQKDEVDVYEVAGDKAKKDEVSGKEMSAHEVEEEKRDERDTVRKYFCDERDHILHSRNFNRRQAPERYLAIADVPEQLSKGRHHLAELVKWARDMERTLILPRVGCNQMGVKWELPLCAYFDVEKLSEGVDWITEKHFFEINKERNLSMMAVMLLNNWRDCMNPPPRFGEKFYVHVRQLSKGSSRYSELSGFGHPFAELIRDTKAGLCLQLDHLYRTPEKMEKGVKLALEERGADQFDVLVFSKVAITSFVKKSTLEPYLSALRYSPKLVQVVDKMLEERVGAQSVSVHWRMEKFLQQKFCTPQALRSCAEGLVRTLEAMRKEWNLTGVFIASDISGNGDMKSVTLSRSEGKENIPVAVESFQWMVGKIKGVMWEDVDPILPSIDAGIQGILDKVTLARAKVFIQPPDECGGGRSSYTREVGELRALWGMDVVDLRWKISK